MYKRIPYRLVCSTDISKRIIAGDYVLKNKNVKGSQAWEEVELFIIEVFGIACCYYAKSCLVYNRVA